MSQRVFSVSSNAIFKKIVKLVSVKILFTNYTSWKTVIFDQFYEDWAIQYGYIIEAAISY